MGFINKTTGDVKAGPISIAPEVMYSVAVYHPEKQPQKDKGTPNLTAQYSLPINSM